MRVNIDGNFYELKAGSIVTRQPVKEFNDNLRLQGQQTRADRSLISSWLIDKWSVGFGVYRMDYTNPAHVEAFWDSEHDSRTPGQLIHGALPIQLNIVPSWGEMRYHAVSSNNLLFMSNKPVGTASRIMFNFQPGSQSIGSYNAIQLVANENERAYIRGFYAQGNFLYTAAVPSGQSLTNLYRNVLALSSGTLIGSTSIDFSSDTQIAMVSGKLYAYGLDSSSRAIMQQYDSPEGAVASTNVYRTTATLPTAAIPTLVSPILTDGVSVYVGLPEGIWDISPTLAENVIDSSNIIDRNTLLNMFGGNLMLKNKESLIAVNPNTLGLTAVGLDRGQGLPTNKKGQITSMCSSYKYLFASVLGGGSYSSVFTFDGTGWSFLSKVPSVGAYVRDMFLSASPDGIERLWMLFSTGNPCFLLNPNDNPLQAGTYSFMGSAYTDFPVFDGGMPEVSAGFYDFSLNTDKVGSPTTIQLCYGLDFGTPTLSLGNAGTISHQFMIGSPYGVEGRTMQPKLITQTANSGTTPIIRSLVQHYYKTPKKREAFSFTIDLRATAIREQRPLEAVVGSLDYLRDLRTLSPFWYGRVATKAVRVLDLPSLEDIPLENIYEDERQGYVEVQVMEMI